MPVTYCGESADVGLMVLAVAIACGKVVDFKGRGVMNIMINRNMPVFYERGGSLSLCSFCEVIRDSGSVFLIGLIDKHGSACLLHQFVNSHSECSSPSCC